MSPTARGTGRARRRAERLRQSLIRRRYAFRGSLLSPRRIVLGVDPGSRHAGWAVVAGLADNPQLKAAGAISMPQQRTFSERLAILHREMSAIVAAHAPTDAAVEAPFHGVSARSALHLAHARGVILAVLGTAGIPVHEYSPATIKKAVTGNGHAEKHQVQAMIRHLVPDVGEQTSPDIADAIATALCHLFGQATPDALARVGVVHPRRR